MYLNSAGESTNSSTHFHSTPNTSLNLDSATSIEANSRKLTPSTYKGVIPQPNGRWGAQIYEKHNRVWLGTFNTEHEAAKAYDVAAKRFKGPYAITNMKQHEHNDIELAFLNMHSKEDIVDMLRKHTYHQELEKGKKNIVMHHPSKFGPNLVGSHASQSPRVHLFDKVLTPSDVGRLNRLVIPKQHAENHFAKNSEKTSLKDVFLSFEDAQGKVWRFRYSYWDSSQSYVVTKGWIHFVKEKGLKAGDVVRFDRSADDDKRLYIDYKVSNELKVKHAEPVKIVKLFGVNVCKCRRE